MFGAEGQENVGDDIDERIGVDAENLPSRECRVGERPEDVEDGADAQLRRTPITAPIAGWSFGANRNEIPTRRITSLMARGSSSIFTPSSASRSALPHDDETARLPCFATSAPAPAATSAAIVEMLNVPRPSPPVPQVSMTRTLSTSSGVTRSRIAIAAPVISSAVSPFIRRAMSSALFCTSDALPSIISAKTNCICWRSRSWPSTSRLMASAIMRRLAEN